MKEPIVASTQQYEKGKKVYKETEDRFSWLVCQGDEKTVSEAIKKTKARIAVLGTNKYENELYLSLSENAGNDPALIARFGVGYDGLDTSLCKKHNIFLTITPGTLDESVAEHAIALLLSVAKSISVNDREMHERIYKARTGMELAGKRLGIAGFGRIGKQVALIASRGFGMKICAFDCVTLEDQALQTKMSTQDFLSHYGVVEYFTDFRDFAGNVNIITIHIAADETTRHFFNAEKFEDMNDGTILINTARGSIISEKDLFSAISSKKIETAALDVYVNEPYEPEFPGFDLRNLSQVVLTSHTASNTHQSNKNMAEAVVKNIRLYMAGKYDELSTV